MKKLIAVFMVVMVIVFVLCGCELNNQMQTVSGNRITSGADVNRFDYAWVVIGGRIIAEGKVEQWRDYSNSDTVQVVVDGNYYLTHYTNVVLKSDVRNKVGYSFVEE